MNGRKEGQLLTSATRQVRFQWFSVGIFPLKHRVREALLGSRLADTGWFNREYLEHLIEAHNSGARDYSAPIWTLLMFEAFLRNVMEAGLPE